MGRDSANKPSYGEMRDKLTCDDVNGKPAPLTIEAAELRDLAPAGSRREDNKIILTFREFPGKEYIANATSYKTLCMKLGDDFNRWAGKVIVMAPTTNTFDGKAYEKLHVAAPERWDKVMQTVERATTKATATKAK
jgi:hypothetical protein